MTITAAAAPYAIDDDLDPLYSVQELSRMGLGHPTTIRARIHEVGVPTEILDGRGTFAVRKSNIRMLRKPGAGRRRPQTSVVDAPHLTTSDVDDLAALAARMVSTWPRLSDERKRELSALLATP